MLKLTETEANKFAADCNAAGLPAKVGYTPDDRVTVTVRIKHEATGNSATYMTAYAEGTLPDVAALATQLRGELAASARTTRGAIRAERRRS